MAAAGRHLPLMRALEARMSSKPDLYRVSDRALCYHARLSKPELYRVSVSMCIVIMSTSEHMHECG
eukprot:1134332-Pelagomonas_calceolata.AAC.1